MELKLACVCGQKYKFDVEPLNGRMPASVACPVCGVDGTEWANQLIAQQTPLVLTPAPAVAAVAASVAARPVLGAGVAAGQFNLGLGITGAVAGATLGAALMFGFYAVAHFRFPLMGTCVGASAGYGAQLLGRGTDSLLGAIAGAVAAVATAGALYLMFGSVAAMYFITIGVSAWFAYKIAS